MVLVYYLAISPWMLIYSVSFAEKQKEEPMKQQSLGNFGKNLGVETSFLLERYDDCTSFDRLIFFICCWWMAVGI
jgi:hypothetical protein